jgi:hypothetical protein
MQVRYGDYVFAVNSVDCSQPSKIIRSATGRPVRYGITFKVQGWLTPEAGNQEAFTLAQAAMIEAFQVGYQDFVLLQDNGLNSGYGILNTPSITGVQIIDGPNFPGGIGDYATVLRFDITAYAEYLIDNAEDAVLQFQESLSFQGDCGPDIVWRPCVNAGPVQQAVSPATTQIIIQRGRAVGHTDYPTPPAPIFPAQYYQGKYTVIDPESPRQVGQGYIEYPISWQYRFEANIPLSGTPNLPPF